MIRFLQIKTIFLLSGCDAKLDLVFLVDGSSIKNTTTKSLIKQVVSAFKVGQMNARFAVVAYSRDAKVIYGFKSENSSMNDMEKTFELIHFPTDGTHIGQGLELTNQDLFHIQPRKDSHKVLVVLLDAPSLDNVSQPSLSLRNMSVEIFAIGMGSNYDKNQLNDIASDPDNLHVFSSANDGIESLVTNLTKAICQGRYSYFIFKCAITGFVHTPNIGVVLV